MCLFHVLPLSFHARYFHVLPLSVHILSLSLHAMSKSSQIEYSECMTLVTMVVTIYMCEYWWKKTNIHSYKSIFFRVHIPFMPFILLSVSCQFPFTSFHVPSISVNHIFVLRSPYLISLLSFFFHVLLMFLWFPFPFVSFSFSFSFSCSFSFSFHFTLLSLQFPSLFPSSH